MIPIRIKAGVRLRGLSPQALLVIQVAAPIWESVGAPELWITSGTDGRHSRNSYHHCGDGLDLRTRNLPGGYQGAAAQEATTKLQGSLGAEYDVVLEANHIHVEYEG